VILSLLLAAFVLAGLFAAAVVTSRRRRTALKRLGDSPGWRWSARDDAAYAGLRGRPFGPASGRRATDVLRGTHRGRPVLVFDYSWLRYSSDGEGRQRGTIGRAAVCVLTLSAEHPSASMGGRWRRRSWVRVDRDTLLSWRPGLHTADTVPGQLDALSDVADALDARAAGTLAG
jgi:hypothetical protein